jgi:hypothetical protein
MDHVVITHVYIYIYIYIYDSMSYLNKTITSNFIFNLNLSYQHFFLHISLNQKLSYLPLFWEEKNED